MIFESVCVGPMQVNCYILAPKERSQAIIVDPGAQVHRIRRALDKHGLQAAFIINTHGHYDHIGCDDKFAVPVYVHADDANMLKDAVLNLSSVFAYPYEVKSRIELLQDKQRIKLDSLEMEVIHLPGHTPGGIALLMRKPDEKILLTGDTLFCRGIGRSDLPGGDERLLKDSIRERLFILPGDTRIFPGHGPASTIAQEKEEFNR